MQWLGVRRLKSVGAQRKEGFVPDTAWTEKAAWQRKGRQGRLPGEGSESEEEKNETDQVSV